MMIAIIIVAAVAVAIVAIAVLGKKSGDALLKKAVEVDVITMESIVQFFKQPGVTAELRKNNDLIAVAIKKDAVVSGERKINLIAALFNSKTNEVVSLDGRVDNPLNVLSSKMDDALQNAFGGKDMLVLR